MAAKALVAMIEPFTRRWNEGQPRWRRTADETLPGRSSSSWRMSIGTRRVARVCGGATSTGGLSLPGMTSIELDGPDAPACPLLGLAADRRSHFTYPHPGHRCFAREHPATTDARRQATYCLSRGYTACNRYQTRQRPVPAGEGLEGRQASRGGSALPGGAPAGEVAGPGTVVHVFRVGDSLARIAGRYALTVEQIATANGLAPNVAVADGTRLVIPLGPPAASVPGR
jgi:LysM domain